MLTCNTYKKLKKSCHSCMWHVYSSKYYQKISNWATGAMVGTILSMEIRWGGRMPGWSLHLPKKTILWWDKKSNWILLTLIKRFHELRPNVTLNDTLIMMRHCTWIFISITQPKMKKQTQVLPSASYLHFCYRAISQII